MTEGILSSGTHVAAIVLAAGGSSRLGQPKQLVALEGEPLLHRTTRIALASRCARVLVVLGSNAPKIAKALDDLPLEIVLNDQWESGMASSVRRGIEAIGNMRATAALLLPCDLPRLNAAHLDTLIQKYQAGVPMVASQWHSPSQGAPVIAAPALFDRRYFPELLALQGDEGARKLFRAHRDALQTVTAPDLSFDLDTPDDLQRMVRNSKRPNSY